MNGEGEQSQTKPNWIFDWRGKGVHVIELSGWMLDWVDQKEALPTIFLS